MSDPRTAPAGWYPEPSGAEGQRWWDGTQWTEYSTPLAAPPQPVQPQPAYGQYAPQPAYGAAAPTANSGQPAPYGQPEASTVDATTPTATLWVWLIIALPVLSVAPLFLVDWRRFMERSMAAQSSLEPMAQLAPYTDPWYLATALFGWVAYGLVVLFSFLDRRELLRRGFPQPFHWAWSFLSSIVYVIGRSVVVKRRAGRGTAPMWVVIAITAALLVVFTVWFAVIMTMAFEIAFETASTY